jgi:hypothetical protein
MLKKIIQEMREEAGLYEAKSEGLKSTVLETIGHFRARLNGLEKAVNQIPHESDGSPDVEMINRALIGAHSELVAPTINMAKALRRGNTGAAEVIYKTLKTFLSRLGGGYARGM